MTDHQIKMLLRLCVDEVKMLLDQGEYSLYRGIRDRMVELVREYQVGLPLNCLQFRHFANHYSRRPE